MRKKKETPGANKNNNKNEQNRNTSYYKSRVSRKPKTESSPFLDKAKKRQLTSNKLAMLVLGLLMIVFTGIILLGSWLNSLVGPSDETLNNTADLNNGNNPFTTQYQPAANSNIVGAEAALYSTDINAPQVFDISSTFYNYNGVYLDIEKLDSLDSLKVFIDNIKSKGINAVNIDIKKDDGTTLYPIDGQTAAVTGTDRYINIPIKDIINMLHDNQLYVSGTIACFKDSLASTQYVDWALRKSSTDLKMNTDIWTDTDGSSWLNAYSQGARDYITNIVTEVADSKKFGFDEIILSWFFFPNVINEKSVVYNDGGLSKYAVIKDFVTAERIAIDDIAPTVKLGLSIPLIYFLNVPNVTMGLNPADLADRCNFFATTFAPAYVPSGLNIDGAVISNPESDPYGTVKALCAHFKYMTDSNVINFRPYLQAFNEYGSDQIEKQKQALSESNITMWQLTNYDNEY